MAKDNQPYTMDRYLQQVIDNSLKEVHTCLPGKIVSFDTSTQIAEIQPLIKRKFIDDDIRDLPLCINCPVMFPRGGGFIITFPVQAGDECLVMFSERALDTWLQSGDTQTPLDTRRHSLSDAIAVLGLYSQPNKLGSFHSSGIELKNDAGTTYFRLDDSGITIKGNVDIDGDVDITGDNTANNFDSSGIGVDFNTHIHTGDSGGNTGIPK